MALASCRKDSTGRSPAIWCLRRAAQGHTNARRPLGLRALSCAADVQLSMDDHDHPHSLKPHTWHFMHPSANSSCDPQSGQAPTNVSCIPLSIICSLDPLALVEGWLDTSSTVLLLSCAPGNSSSCTPSLYRRYFSIAIPTASGTDNILFGPRPITRSELIPFNWR